MYIFIYVSIYIFYIYVHLSKAGEQGLLKRKTENNSNPIYIPRNSVSLILLYDN